MRHLRTCLLVGLLLSALTGLAVAKDLALGGIFFASSSAPGVNLRWGNDHSYFSAWTNDNTAVTTFGVK